VMTVMLGDLGPLQFHGHARGVVRQKVMAVLRELSAGVRRLEAVALRHPVMPAGDGFGGRVVGINSHQL
jgi:hypothetical protein